LFSVVVYVMLNGSELQTILMKTRQLIYMVCFSLS